MEDEIFFLSLVPSKSEGASKIFQNLMWRSYSWVLLNRNIFAIYEIPKIFRPKNPQSISYACGTMPSVEIL